MGHILDAYNEMKRQEPIMQASNDISACIMAGLHPFKPSGPFEIYYDHWLAHYPNQVVVSFRFRDHPYLDGKYHFDAEDVVMHRSDMVVATKAARTIFEQYRYRPITEREGTIELGEN